MRKLQQREDEQANRARQKELLGWRAILRLRSERENCLTAASLDLTDRLCSQDWQPFRICR